VREQDELGGEGQTKFRGVEEARPLLEPIRLEQGVYVTHALWRSGEAQGPPEGAQVGVVYALPDGFSVKARRDIFIVEGNGGDVAIEPWSEPEFIRSLIEACRIDNA
jgi:hypothetical protein